MIVVGILAAVGGGALAALIAGLFQSPKTKAEAAKLLAEQGQTIDGRWQKLSDELDERLSRERDEHKQELQRAREEHKQAIEELRAAGQRDTEALNARLEAVERKLAESEEDRHRLREELAIAERGLDRTRAELNRERRMTRSVITWAIMLRDEIVAMGGTVPEIPRQVEDYLTELNDPHEPDHL